MRIDVTHGEFGYVFLPLLIPKRIVSALTLEDWDQAELILHRELNRHASALLFVSREVVFRMAVREATKAVCEHLYTAFTFAQYLAGNDVWAVPRSMVDDISRNPELDAADLKRKVQ